MQNVHGKNCRLSFMTGDRAISLASASINAVSSIAKLTSSKPAPAEVVTKTSELCNSVTELRRGEKKLLMEIAMYESDKVKEKILGGKNAFVQRPDGGYDFINKIIGETRDAVKGTGRVVVIALGETRGSGPVFVVGDKESVAQMVDKVKSVVKDIKGGGGGEKWQGKVVEWQKGELRELQNVVEG